MGTVRARGSVRLVSRQSMITVSPVGNSTRRLTRPIKCTLLAHTIPLLRLPTLWHDRRHHPRVPIPVHPRSSHLPIPSPSTRKRTLPRRHTPHPQSTVSLCRTGNRHYHPLCPLDPSQRRLSIVSTHRLHHNHLILHPIPITTPSALLFVALE